MGDFNPANTEKFEQLTKKLENRIRTDDWMATSGVENQLRESLGHRDFDKAQDLVEHHEETWSDTLHFEVLYRLPIYRKVRKIYEEEKGEEMEPGEAWTIASEHSQKLWEAYHEKHNTHELAEKVWKE